MRSLLESVGTRLGPLQLTAQVSGGKLVIADSPSAVAALRGGSKLVDDAAYELGELYEGNAFKQYRRAAQYYERCFQWNPKTHLDARIKAARLYDKNLQERTRAIEIYREIVTRETDPKRITEANKRLAELSTVKK